MPKRYLILHLNSNGDLLYATAIARQLKENDDPGCHITWAVATPFKNILLHNPHIDVLWEVPAEDYLDIKNRAFREVESEANKRFQSGEWDEVICPQLMYENMSRYDGTIRRAVLRAYSKPIADVTPVVQLITAEIENVSSFADHHALASYRQVVLFECSPLSGQSSVTPLLAIEIAEQLLQHFPKAAFILSSNKKIEHPDKRIIDGSSLSFRENAELTHYCTHLIGCSSGITWISTSSWAKSLPMLQLSSTGINPIGRDFEREGLDKCQLVEMYRFTVPVIVECMKLILQNNFILAKERYHQRIPPAADFVEGILLYLLNNSFYQKAFSFLGNNLKHHPSLLGMLIRLPFLLPKRIWLKRKQKG